MLHSVLLSPPPSRLHLVMWFTHFLSLPLFSNKGSPFPLLQCESHLLATFACVSFLGRISLSSRVVDLSLSGQLCPSCMSFLCLFSFSTPSSVFHSVFQVYPTSSGVGQINPKELFSPKNICHKSSFPWGFQILDLSTLHISLSCPLDLLYPQLDE